MIKRFGPNPELDAILGLGKNGNAKPVPVSRRKFLRDMREGLILLSPLKIDIGKHLSSPSRPPDFECFRLYG